MRSQDIDHGQQFDFGKTSREYAKFRDIYPGSFTINCIQWALDPGVAVGWI